MKKLLFFLFFIFFIISSLNAFQVNFGEGKDYEGFFKPMVFNVSVLNYYDNGTKSVTNYPILSFLIVVKSPNFSPYDAHCYVKINDNITKDLGFYYTSTNVPTGYKDKYIFSTKIVPQELGYEFDYDGFTGILNYIKKVTFYLEYMGDTYTYTIENFSQYVNFLKTYNNSIIDVDTSNYPVISSNINNEDYNVSDLGLCILFGRYDIWNDYYTPAGGKIDYAKKALFGQWFSVNNPSEFTVNLADIPNINIPATPGYIAKVKSEIRENLDQEVEGSNILRFQVAFKKISGEKTYPPITNLSGWMLLGCLYDDIYINKTFNDIFNTEKVNSVWSWQGNNWAIWSPDPTLMNLILYYGVPKLNIIYHYQGFWVNFK